MVWLDHWQVEGQGDPFPLRLQAQQDAIAIDLLLEAGDRPRVLQGEDGLSQRDSIPAMRPITIRIRGYRHAAALPSMANATLLKATAGSIANGVLQRSNRTRSVGTGLHSG